MRSLNSGLACGLLLSVMMSSLHAQTSKPVTMPEVVAVTVNGEEVADFASVLRTNDGKIFIARQLLSAVRLNMPNAEVLHIDGNDYCRIDNLPDTHVAFDDATQTLRIVASGSAFNGTTASIGGQQRRNVQAPPLGKR